MGIQSKVERTVITFSLWTCSIGCVVEVSLYAHFYSSNLLIMLVTTGMVGKKVKLLLITG